MASERQIEANRKNARRSTGPRTALGKARSSLNAVRRGLSARSAVLPQEDHRAYLDLLASLRAEFRPQGPVEAFLIQQMASAQWRLLRTARMETGFLMAGIDASSVGPAWAKRMRNLSEDDEVTRLLGVLFMENCGSDAFARLTSYENMLNAEYFGALRTLTNLRKTPDPQPPARNHTNQIPFPTPDSSQPPDKIELAA
jgi:hypothetical protein